MMNGRKTAMTAAIAAGLTILMLGIYGVLTAEEYDPETFEVILHRTDLYTGSGDATPETVFDGGGMGSVVDLVSNPGGVFGEGDVAEGTYKRIKLTLGNMVSVAGTNPCDEMSAYAGTFLIDDGLASDAQVEVFFATADDGGDSIVTADGSSTNPFLMQNPIVVEDGETTVVRLAFYTSHSLVCIGGVDVSLRPPTVSVASYIEGETPVVDPSGEYWFAHFNVNAHLFEEQTGDWLDPETATADEILNRIEASTGWGSITLYAPDVATGIGSWRIENAGWRNGGFGEHRHNFATWDTSNEEGYAGTAPNLPLQGTYQVTGSQIFVKIGSSATLEGYITVDGASFILVNLSGVDDSDVVFAVQKASGFPSNLTGGSYVIVSPQISFRYDTSGASAYPATGVDFNGQVIMLRGTGSGDDAFSWGSELELDYAYFGDTIDEVFGQTPREVTNRTPGISGVLEFDPDGLATVTPDDNTIFIGMGGDDTSGYLGLFAGMAAEYDPDSGGHRLNNGFIVEADPTPTEAELAGRWALMGINWEGMEGDDGFWYTGDEEYELLMTYGTLEFDGSGSVTWNVIDKDIITQSIDYGTGTGPVTTVTEYYEPDNPIGNPSGTAIPLTLFHINESAGSSTIVARVILDKRGNTLLFWSPLDEGGVPEEDSTTDAANDFSMGVGVKIQ
jgi:hypothetical protein